MSRSCSRSPGADPFPGFKSRGLGSSWASLPGNRSSTWLSERNAIAQPSGGSAGSTRTRDGPASWHHRHDLGGLPGFPPWRGRSWRDGRRSSVSTNRGWPGGRRVGGPVPAGLPRASARSRPTPRHAGRCRSAQFLGVGGRLQAPHRGPRARRGGRASPTSTGELSAPFARYNRQLERVPRFYHPVYGECFPLQSMSCAQVQGPGQD
ncbi:hypothetical protein BH23PLA1_BH23PLA1_32180 [soil metagenome]